MKPLPTDPMQFQSRIMEALIADIRDTTSRTFARLDAIRAISRDGGGDSNPLPANNGN